MGSRANTGGIFVDLSVAVVVFSVVADLGGGGVDVGGTDQFGIFASGVCAFLTLAFFGAVGADTAFFGEGIVDLTVAIVVLAIADLGLWGHLPKASLPFSGLTLLLARAAKSLVGGVCRAIITFAFFPCDTDARGAVGDAVAIVIDLVAAIFGLGLVGAFADKLAVLALGDAAFAGAFGVWNVANLAVFRERFVGFPVAVVVFAITDLDLRGDFVVTRSVPKAADTGLDPCFAIPNVDGVHGAVVASGRFACGTKTRDVFKKRRFAGRFLYGLFGLGILLDGIAFAWATVLCRFGSFGGSLHAGGFFWGGSFFGGRRFGRCFSRCFSRCFLGIGFFADFCGRNCTNGIDTNLCPRAIRIDEALGWAGGAAAIGSL